MSQFDYGNMDPTQVSGSMLADYLNKRRDAANSSHSGPERPEYVRPGLEWLDISAKLWQLKMFDGLDDVGMGFLDSDFHTFAANIRNLEPEVSVPSAPLVDLGQVPSVRVKMTGNIVINSFGSAINCMRMVRAAGAFKLKNGSTMQLPGNSDITAAAGDYFIAVSDQDGNWWVPMYSRADGRALVAPVLGTAAARNAAAVEDYVRWQNDNLLAAKTVWDAAANRQVLFSSTINLDFATSFNFWFNLDDNATMGVGLNHKTCQTGSITIYQPGGKTLSFSSTWKTQGGVVPPLPSFASWNKLYYFIEEAAHDDVPARIHYTLARDIK